MSTYKSDHTCCKCHRELSGVNFVHSKTRDLYCRMCAARMHQACIYMRCRVTSRQLFSPQLRGPMNPTLCNGQMLGPAISGVLRNHATNPLVKTPFANSTIRQQVPLDPLDGSISMQYCCETCALTSSSALCNCQTGSACSPSAAEKLLGTPLGKIDVRELTPLESQLFVQFVALVQTRARQNLHQVVPAYSI